MKNTTKPPYKEYGEYLIYRDSRVFSKRKGIFLTPVMGKGKSKYFVVKVPHRIKLHRLIAELFVDNPHNKPHVNHFDGNKSNNNYWNLKWCTFGENMTHSHSTGLHNNKGQNSGRAKLREIHVRVIRECIERKFNYTDVANYFKIKPTTILDIKSGRSWAHL